MDTTLNFRPLDVEMLLRFQRLSRKSISIVMVLLFVAALLPFGNLKSQTTVFQFNFTSGNTPSTDNAQGTPSISTVGTLTTATSGCTGNGYSASAWNAGDAFQFTVNTTGFVGLTFSYNEQSSSTNISSFEVRASTDATNWTTIRSTYTPPTSCTSSGNISLPSEFDNQSAVYIQIYKSVNADQSARTFRIDDATLTGFSPVNYYYNGTGNINNVASWGNNTNGSGTAPTNFTSNAQVFNIRNTAAVTLNGGWTVSGTGAKVVVGDGTNACNFTVGSSNVLSAAVDVSAAGTLTLSTTGSITSINLGSLNPTSTVDFASTSAQTVPVERYGNLTISGSKGANDVTFAGGCTIAGNLTITATGTSGSGFVYVNNSATDRTININGNYVQSGAIDVEFGSGNGNTTVNLAGNFSKTNGYMVTSTSTLNVLFNLSGSNNTIQCNGGTEAKWIDINILNGAVYTMNGNYSSFGSSGTNAVFTVSSGGLLNTNGFSVLSSGGNARFVVAAGGTLGVSSAAGITTSGASGNIQTATRTYTAGANYVYNGTVAQATGNGLTSNTPAGLTINNSAGVTLSANTAISGTLTLSSGLLNTSTFTMTVNSGGSVSGGSSTSFVNGKLARIIGTTAATSFPVGKGTTYMPAVFTSAAASSRTVTIEYFTSGSPITAANTSTARFGDEYWNINQSATGTNYTIALNNGGVTPTGTVLMLRREGTGSASSNNTTFSSPNYSNSTAFSTGNTSNDVTLVETAIPLTITGLTGSDKVYDGTTTASASGIASLSGIVSPDVVTLAGTPVFTFGSASVGVGKSITTTGYSLTGTNAGAYSLSQPTGLTANITQQSLTITGLTGVNKAYDGTATATVTGTAALSGVVAGDASNVTLGGTGTFTFADATVGTSKAITASGFSISGTASGNYSLTQPSGLTANITAKTLTVTGATTANKVYDGTNTATVTGGTLVGIVGSDVVTLTQSGTFAQTGVGTSIAITSTSSISGANSANYSLTQPSLTARDITAKALTVTGATTTNKVYDGTNAATVTGGTLVGIVGSDVVTLTQSGTFAQTGVGTGIAITSTSTLGGANAENYSLTQPSLTARDITAKTLTVSASNQSKCFGTTFTFAGTEFTTSGLVGADAVSSVTLTSTGSASAAATGTYSIVPSAASGTGLSNYSITYNNGTLTVNASPNLSNFSISATTPLAGAASTVTISSSSLAAGTYTVNYDLSGNNTATGATASVTIASGSGTFNTSNLANTGYTIIDINFLQNASACQAIPVSGNTDTLVMPDVVSTTWNATTSWTAPAGVSSIQVECWGGGGRGGSTTNGTETGGGGGGAYARDNSLAVTTGTSYTVTVGSGSTSTSAGGDSWFLNNTTVLAKGGNSVADNSATGATGGSSTNSIGDAKWAGGNGASGTSGSNGGGGGSSAGTSTFGANGSGSSGGIAPTGGGNGGAGRTGSSGNGTAGSSPGGGGGGARATGTQTGGVGANGQVKITYNKLTYKSEFVSADLGSSTWCAGETRQISVTIRNVGTATWTTGANGTPTINIGVKWNTNGSNWADYHVRNSANNLAPGETRTYTFNLTAANNTGSVYTTNLAAGSNNITFDVVYEGISWFGNNGGGVGPGNTVFTSTAQTISTAAPTISNQTASSTYGSAATYTVVATGASSYGGTMPSGFSINSSTGVISVAASVPAGVYSIPVTAASSAGCSSGATLTYTQNAKALTVTGITASNKVYDGTTTATLSGGSLVGVVSPDVVTLTQAGSFADKNVGTAKTVTASCSLSGADAGNYTLTQPTGITANITAAPLTITANDASRCFGTDYTLGTTAFTSQGLQGTDAISSVTLTCTQATGFALPGSYSIIPSNATGAVFSASNYNISYVNGTLVVANTPSFSTQPATSLSPVCANQSAETLTVAANPRSGTLSGYQWFSNAANSSFGGTLISGATSSSYTPQTTTSGTLYYYAVATNSFGCSTPSNTSGALVVNALPTVVSIGGGGTGCNSATLTASNGSSGTIYFQGTTSGGTSTAVPSTVQNISASGTYYFRAQSAQGCWGPEGSTTVTLTAPATTGVTHCQGAASQSLTASASCATIQWYTVASGGTSLGTGTSFNPVGVAGSGISNTNTAGTVTFYAACSDNATCRSAVNYIINALPSTPTVSTVAATCSAAGSASISNYSASLTYTFSPSGPTAGTGGAISGLVNGTSYTVTARNTNNCTSAASASFSVAAQLTTTPAPGSITGTTGVCAGVSGNTYSITAVSGATGYTWTVPTGWSITAGTNTNSVTVTSGIGNQDGNITVTANNTCGSSTAATLAVSVTPNTWMGTQNNNWTTASNWSCGIVPVSGSDIIISPSATNPPNINTDITLSDLEIPAGKTFEIGSNTLTINGTVSGEGSLTGSHTSSLVVNSNAGSLRFTQNGAGNFLRNFTLNSGATASLGNELNITGGMSANMEGTLSVKGNAVLTTNGNLAIKSNNFGTARIDSNTVSTTYISGAVSVERFIPQNATKSWRLLAANTVGQSLNSAWQEGQVGMSSNTRPGFGTMITGPGVDDADAISKGFDRKTPGYSILRYVPESDALWGVTNTLTTKVDDYSGYFIFIRGDRSNNGSFGGGAPVTNTTLRSKGTLMMGSRTITIPAGQFALIGNPYPSRIDLRQVIVGPGITNSFQVWDPKLVGGYGLGAYQTITRRGPNFEITPGGGGYPQGGEGVTQNFIESGSAFFMQNNSSSSSTVTIMESSKTSGSSVVNRPTNPASVEPSFRTRLYAMNTASAELADGNCIDYDPSYSNLEDELDVHKNYNFGENLGVFSNNVDLVVERRNLPTETDTIFYKMGNLKRIPYRLDFNANDLASTGLIAELQDAYLNTSTPVSLDGLTSYSFTVDANTASSASKRFRIIFRPQTPLPVTVTDIRARAQNNRVAVEWTVSNQVNLREYRVQRSTDGRNFSAIGTVAARNTTAATEGYRFDDEQAVSGWNYYRIQCVDLDGRFNYTSVVKVMLGKAASSFTVYPNPIEGSTMNVQLVNQKAGRYTLRLLNSEGRTVMTRNLDHTGGSTTQQVDLPGKVANGRYNLEVSGSDEAPATVIPVMVNNK